MPIKQRRAKGRAFNEYCEEQLIEGPDGCLLAGVGYLAGRFEWFRDMDEIERAEVLAEMEGDWRIHGPELMQWWTAGGKATIPGTKPHSLPWAAEQFGLSGEPPCQ